ncbi:MAG: hypothetical protein ACRD0B_05530, partial [Acidimicrobiales bacterium]
VRVKNLASFVLSKAARRLPADWQVRLRLRPGAPRDLRRARALLWGELQGGKLAACGTDQRTWQARPLHDQSRVVIADNPSAIDTDGLVEDYLVIERIEPGALYFS